MQFCHTTCSNFKLPDIITFKLNFIIPDSIIFILPEKILNLLVRVYNQPQMFLYLHLLTRKSKQKYKRKIN